MARRWFPGRSPHISGDTGAVLVSETAKRSVPCSENYLLYLLLPSEYLLLPSGRRPRWSQRTRRDQSKSSEDLEEQRERTRDESKPRVTEDWLVAARVEQDPPRPSAGMRAQRQQRLASKTSSRGRAQPSARTTKHRARLRVREDGKQSRAL